MTRLWPPRAVLPASKSGATEAMLCRVRWLVLTSRCHALFGKKTNEARQMLTVNPDARDIKEHNARLASLHEGIP